MNCIHCGSPLSAGDHYCTKCGMPQSAPTPQAAAPAVAQGPSRSTPLFVVAIGVLVAAIIVLVGFILHPAGNELAYGDETDLSVDTLIVPQDATGNNLTNYEVRVEPVDARTPTITYHPLRVQDNRGFTMQDIVNIQEENTMYFTRYRIVIVNYEDNSTQQIIGNVVNPSDDTSSSSSGGSASGAQATTSTSSSESKKNPSQKPPEEIIVKPAPTGTSSTTTGSTPNPSTGSTSAPTSGSTEGSGQADSGSTASTGSTPPASESTSTVSREEPASESTATSTPTPDESHTSSGGESTSSSSETGSSTTAGSSADSASASSSASSTASSTAEPPSTSSTTGASAGSTSTSSSASSATSTSADSGSQLRSEYAQVLSKLQGTYGVADLKSANGAVGATGLCLAELIDFNRDGVDELLVGYYDPSLEDAARARDLTDPEAYVIEVWGMKDGAAKKLHAQEPEFSNGGFAFLVLNERANDTVLQRGTYGKEGGNSHTYAYYGFEGKEFVELTNLMMTGLYSSDNEYFIDGQEVGKEEYQGYSDEFLGDHHVICFSFMTAGSSSAPVDDRTLYTATEVEQRAQATIASLQ